ncbi:hypothetical protein SAMN05216319_1653 [Duganella sp. CF402]|uniref:substrate-binding periplasmic protein n=1 Tax=unclassified Duganella TaxID=2636909 RepID=UPI0008CB54FA|nr:MULTISPECIES: ABC transporter substrate-binding protein [unclassified Duganella]RZT09902.1 amino acid ABC transporter substrate-binding protein (PAAT family) [Duganella sp. BK701]SEL37809.1 hypothetical protein SAMN05216319_1653 [Duganella sp. CF402]
MRLLWILCLWCGLAAAEPTAVRFPRSNGDGAQGDYGVALLQLALSKAGGHYRVDISPTHMQQNRALAELQSPRGSVDVVATMTSIEREAKMLPVRIPMTRGLIGWRIGLLRADRRELLKAVRGLDDLRQFTAGQGQDWPDTGILRHSGLPVQPVAIYQNLFGLLKADRYDWAPRSANEIWAEAARHPELAIDPYVVLRYPTADYFFVNRNNSALAEAIRRGLEAALADGSFEKLFYAYYGKQIRQARLDKRVLINLPNPLLPPQTPLSRRELWFTLDDLKRIP